LTVALAVTAVREAASVPSFGLTWTRPLNADDEAGSVDARFEKGSLSLTTGAATPVFAGRLAVG
jgi:hypothetical protein